MDTIAFFPQMLPYLHSAARKVVVDYRAAVKGKKTDAPRWHRCVHALGFNNYNAHAIAIPSAAMFVARHVDREERDIMEDIIASIRGSFAGVIERSDWMDKETREFAQKKLKNMRQNVVYPPLITNRTFAEKYLKGLNVSKSSYFRNVLNIQVYVRLELAYPESNLDKYFFKKNS